MPYLKEENLKLLLSTVVNGSTSVLVVDMFCMYWVVQCVAVETLFICPKASHQPVSDTQCILFNMVHMYYSATLREMDEWTR